MIAPIRPGKAGFCAALTIAMLTSTSLQAQDAPQDSFYWLSEMNKASTVMVVETGIVPADLVRQLSYDRADSVRKSIMEKYKFDPNKFKVVGNGWDNPLAGATDPSNADNNKRNRRVEVKVFPLESN